eukprot:TRINITY_DN8786_c0_g1_i1.p1 TRINITY_DN8786_c0_g1~~TRINITY_DN8786_c0_g1_i1.p1  ORF type:complete len:1027 (+),score=261.18 TRINITY_DN8786_c0_g1_i1:380-3460(+)
MAPVHTHPVAFGRRALPMLLILACTALAILATPTDAQSTYYVSLSGDASNDGLTPATAKDLIQDAIDVAVDGDTVVVLPGTYDESNCNLVVSKSITLASSSQDPSDVTIDCKHKERALSIEGSPDGTFGSTLTPTIVGITFHRGQASVGGNVRIRAAQPTFSNCVISHGIALTTGGGVDTDINSIPIFSGVQFLSNEAPGSGASIQWHSKAGGVVGCHFEGNKGKGVGFNIVGSGTLPALTGLPLFMTITDTTFIGERCGAVGMNAAEVTIDRCHFEDIQTAADGGAVLVFGGSVIHMNNSHVTGVHSGIGAVFIFGGHGEILNTVIENSVTSRGSLGIGSDEGDVFVSNCIFRNNVADFTGGGILLTFSPAQVLVQDCLFENNTAPLGGGFVGEGQALGLPIPIMRRCIFRNNHGTDRGGAANVRLQQMIFEECTFDGNRSPRGGAVDLYGELSLTTTFNGCTFTDNVATVGGAISNNNDMLIELLNDCYFEGNEADYGGAVWSSQPLSKKDSAQFRNNRAHFGGGGIFYTDLTVGKKLLDECDCKGNKAQYGDDVATPAYEFSLDDIEPRSKQLKHVDNLHSEVKAKVSLRDWFGQKVAGEETIFNFRVSPEDAIMVDSSKTDEGTAIDPIVSTSGDATFEYSLVGEFGGRYEITFFALGYEPLGNSSYSSEVLDCDDDEYEDEYPPGVPLYKVCRDPSFVDVTSAGKVMQWVFGTIAGVGMLLCLCTFPIIFIYRDRKAISYASPIFSYIILIGLIIAYAAVYPFIVEPTDAACIVRPVLFLLAFAIVLTPLIVRNYRLWKLFSNKGYKVLTISNVQLLVATAIIVAMEICIIILWLAWSTPSWHWHYDDDTDDERIKTCTSDHTDVMLGIAAGFNGIMILCALFLAFKTRGVAEGFNEAKFVAIIIYAIAFASVLLFPLVILTDDPSFRIALTCTGLVVCATIVYLCLFVNKFYVLATKADLEDSYGSTFRASAPATRRTTMTGKRVVVSPGGSSPATTPATSPGSSPRGSSATTSSGTMSG